MKTKRPLTIHALRLMTGIFVVLALSCKQGETPATDDAGAVDTMAVEAPATDWAPDVDTTAVTPDQQDISFCCSNHAPSHCTSRSSEMQRLSEQQNCVFQ